MVSKHCSKQNTHLRYKRVAAFVHLRVVAAVCLRVAAAVYLRVTAAVYLRVAMSFSQPARQLISYNTENVVI